MRIDQIIPSGKGILHAICRATVTRRFCFLARIPLDGIFGNDGKVDGWQTLAAGQVISQLTLRPDQIASN
jgi:hypothetical protein